MTKAERQHIITHVEPEDLLRYGLIPELIGRLPVMSSLHPISREGLMNILSQPKNALVKQYVKLFEMENVELEFDHEALEAIVERALERGTGARALRSIMERSMMDIMYNLPSKEHVTRCFITRDTIETGAEPMYTVQEQKKTA